jgi:hypothetical protein
MVDDGEADPCSQNTGQRSSKAKPKHIILEGGKEFWDNDCVPSPPSGIIASGVVVKDFVGSRRISGSPFTASVTSSANPLSGSGLLTCGIADRGLKPNREKRCRSRLPLIPRVDTRWAEQGLVSPGRSGNDR